jgi:hypothetical protein
MSPNVNGSIAFFEMVIQPHYLHGVISINGVARMNEAKPNRAGTRKVAQGLSCETIRFPALAVQCPL